MSTQFETPTNQAVAAAGLGKIMGKAHIIIFMEKKKSGLTHSRRMVNSERNNYKYFCFISVNYLVVRSSRGTRHLRGKISRPVQAGP